MNELKEFNIDAILSNKSWVVTWKGNPLKAGTLNVEKGGSSKNATLALEHLINRDGMQCARCGRADYLTVDHIVPVSLLQMFGIPRERTYSDWENLQILCKLCNAFKASTLDFANPKTKPLLLKYISEISDPPKKETPISLV